MSTLGEDDVRYSSSPSPEPVSSKPTNEDTPKSSTEFTVEVRRLSRNVNPGHLKEIFGAYGNVVKAECVICGNISTGVGLVYFENSISVQNAIDFLDGV